MTERCEAKIRRKTLDEGASRVEYDFEGNSIDHGADFKEHPAKEEMTIWCEKCGLSTEIIAEGMAPFGAVNEARRMAIEFIRNNCKKLMESGLTSEEMPQDWIQNY